jgi:hypothetical protein
VNQDDGDWFFIRIFNKTEHNAVGRFPEPGDEELLAGPSRNVQVFDPLNSVGSSGWFGDFTQPQMLITEADFGG